MTRSNLRLLLGKLKVSLAMLLAIVVPLQSAQNLGTGIAGRGQTGWARYGTVESVSARAIKLTPLTTGVQPTDLPPGQITGTTRVWSAEALRGFEGSVVVFLLDENKQLVFQTHERHWGVNGEAVPGAPSDRTENWSEAVPSTALAQTRYVAILHGDHPGIHWSDWQEAAIDALIVIIVVACFMAGGEVVISDGEAGCGSGGGDSSDGMAATSSTRMGTVIPKGTLPQLPHVGQMMWVNRTTKQAAWTVFPIHGHRKDDVGDSHYVETSVTVSYAASGASESRTPAGSLPSVGARSAAPAVPCCRVSAIDERSGIVIAHVNVNGTPQQVFRFKPTNLAVLRSLKVGQGIYANFKTKQVSLDGATPCACTWLEGPANSK